MQGADEDGEVSKNWKMEGLVDFGKSLGKSTAL